MLTTVIVHAAEDDPGDRQSKDMPMQAGVEARLQLVIIVIVKVEVARAQKGHQTDRDGDQPAADHDPLRTKNKTKFRAKHALHLVHFVSPTTFAWKGIEADR